MTDELTTTSDRGQLAFDAEQRVIAAKLKTEQGFLELAKALKDIRDNDYYQELGYETVTQWLSSPEIDMAPSSAWALVQLYETYVIKLGLPEEKLATINYTKLRALMPVIKHDPENVDEWLEKARNLRRTDLQKEVKEERIKERHRQIEEAQTITLPSDVQLLHGSAQLLMAQLPPESVHSIITTPPHIDPASPQFLGASLISSQQAYVYYHQNWLTEAYKVLKPNGSIFLIADHHNVFLLGHLLHMLGFKLIRDIIWVHRKNLPVSVHSLMQKHDTILWAYKGDHYTNNAIEIESDVWEFEANKVTEHKQDQPEFLLERIITLGTDPKDTILDPFASSGTTLVVAKRLNRNVIGIEEDEYWFSQCKERLVAYDDDAKYNV